MRIILSVLLSILLAAFVYLLSITHTIGGSRTPRLGAFLHPQKGFWQQAEPVSAEAGFQVAEIALLHPADVYIDERQVPHIYAANKHDMYFVQGYIHARYRLWQMEFQTHAAGGRLSEIMGARQGSTDFLRIDRFFRRLGMVYAAEQALSVMEADPEINSACNAYTQGVNAYINHLRPHEYPLEYKLLDYAPEPWTNKKTALFLKYMSYDLAGGEKDFEMTAARQVFTRSQFEKLYPYAKDSLSPVVPGIPAFKSKIPFPQKPAGADSNYFLFEGSAGLKDTIPQPDPFNGSNNWAVSGLKTASGFPILANDPHLGLNLPAIWFEMQLSCPEGEAYGASFPGSPCIIIGFNRQTAWGFTNGMRDMRDYYEVQFTDESKTRYLFRGETQISNIRTEIIKVRDGEEVQEKIAMTHWGPVMYDKDLFPDKLNTGRYWACRWVAHERSNELSTFYQLNYGQNYNDYLKALEGYKCPAQNMLFASTEGDIAIKHNGYLPAKWLRQGDFLMPGMDSSYAWKNILDDSLNQVMHNPPRGFVSSANQYTYDPVRYPFYMGGDHLIERGNRINYLLEKAIQVTPENMMAMQADHVDEHARLMLPAMLSKMPVTGLSPSEQNWLDTLHGWDFQASRSSAAMTLFRLWADSLRNEVFSDEFERTGNTNLIKPGITPLSLWLRTDSLYLFTDNVNTPSVREGWTHVLYASYRKSVAAFLRLPVDEQKWGRYKATSVRHLLKLDAFSYTNLISDGSNRSINALQGGHGPSWKMVVHLNPSGVEGWAIYPGGQHGNPGSHFYHQFIEDYRNAKHYKLKFWKPEQARNDPHVQHISFVKAF